MHWYIFISVDTWILLLFNRPQSISLTIFWYTKLSVVWPSEVLLRWLLCSFYVPPCILEDIFILKERGSRLILCFPVPSLESVLSPRNTGNFLFHWKTTCRHQVVSVMCGHCFWSAAVLSSFQCSELRNISHTPDIYVHVFTSCVFLYGSHTILKTMTFHWYLWLQFNTTGLILIVSLLVFELSFFIVKILTPFSLMHLLRWSLPLYVTTATPHICKDHPAWAFMPPTMPLSLMDSCAGSDTPVYHHCYPSSWSMPSLQHFGSSPPGWARLLLFLCIDTVCKLWYLALDPSTPPCRDLPQPSQSLTLCWNTHYMNFFILLGLLISLTSSAATHYVCAPSTLLRMQ